MLISITYFPAHYIIRNTIAHPNKTKFGKKELKRFSITISVTISNTSTAVVGH